MSTQILTRYEILGTLGKGGMGEVLKARDLQLKRVVAIKKLLSGTLGGEEARARFLREARLAAQLNHPNIATIYDIFDSDGEAYIVMEYVEGETLRERVARGPLPLAEVFNLSTQIASALATAHKQNVIHRDIKSENIKVTSDGHIKVLDFGLAKQIYQVDETIEDTVKAESLWVTQQGFAAGTPGYTAPEQWKGGQVDGRADIFSFGVVLYEMLTGRAPFPGQSVIERITATMHYDPEPVTNFASVPNQLERIVKKTLAKDPDRRYQSMTEVLQELDTLKRQPVGTGEAPTALVEPSQAVLATRYRILAELGEGGMGKVYQAKDLKLDRTVAIKELRQGILADEKIRARFLREASLLAQLNHPNIAIVHDIIEERDQIFIVMEYIEGERLLDKIKRGPLPSDEAYHYALEVAEALADAHGRHIIHRDIKSANIMITPGGHAKVLDFGLAKRMSPLHLSQTGETQTMAAELTGTRITFGTPKYMSPEQRLTADVDERSDIFSYGVVLCEMLVGEVTFMGEVVAELLEADPKAWPAPLNRIPRHWRALLKKSLAKDPRQRYQAFTDLITDLEQIKDAAEARTELATAVLERRPVVREVEGPRITPTLLRSALALAPALYFLHLASKYADRPESLLYLPLVFLVPIAVFFLPRLVARRSVRIRQLVNGTHPLAFPLMMVNIILVFLTSIAIFDFLGWQSWGDWRYFINQEGVNPDIVLVAIDKNTQEKFAEQGVQLNKPEDLIHLRQFHPKLLQNLTKGGQPKVIAFDMSFISPSDYDDAFAAELRELQENKIPVVIGQEFDPEMKDFAQTTRKIRDALSHNGDFVWGHPIVLSDVSDKGIVRVVPLQIIQAEPTEGVLSLKPFPSISLLMATSGEYDKRWRESAGVLPVPGFAIPIDTSIRYLKNLQEGKYRYEYEDLLVNFPLDKFRTVSYYDVWGGNTDVDFFQKYVLIGSEFKNFEPYRWTPLSEWSPYKIHASALNTILRGTFIHKFSGVPSLLVLLLAAYLVFALAIKLPARSWVLLAVTAGVWIVLFGTAYFLFRSHRIWFDSSYPGVAAAVTGLVTYFKR